MTLIPPFFLDCVVAIGFQTEGAKKTWAASGFLVGEFFKIVEGEKRYSVYLATNRHVFDGYTQAFLRFNPKEARAAQEYLIELKGSDGRRIWHPHNNEKIDIAVVPINANRLKEEGMQIAFFCSDQHMAERKKLLELGITEGDFVYVLGFPMGLVGGERNFVIVRQGVIARIRDALAGAGEEYVLDAMVFPGNSGGPVVTKPEILAIDGTKAVSSSFLIGMVQSYIPYRDVAKSEQTGRTRVVFEENSGLAPVIPIDYVREAIQSFENKRREATA